MLTEQQYIDWATEVASKYNTHHRVIRHVRNCRKQKYPDMPFEDFKWTIVNDAKKTISHIKASMFPVVTEVIHAMTYESYYSISLANKANKKIEDNIKTVYGSFYNLGFRYSIKSFSERLTPEELEVITADIPDPVNEN